MTDRPHRWTIETLREHVLALLNERDRQYRQRFIAQERAVSKAETAAEKRFDAVNEFRSTLADQQRTLMPRVEAELHFARLATVEKAVGALQSRGSGVSAGWGYAFGVAMFILAVVTVVWKVSP